MTHTAAVSCLFSWIFCNMEVFQLRDTLVSFLFVPEHLMWGFHGDFFGFIGSKKVYKHV